MKNSSKHRHKETIGRPKPKEKALKVEEILDTAFGGSTIEKISELSSDALSRLGAIPLLFGDSPVRSEDPGKVVYDSWAQGPAMALRDVSAGHIRRIRLASGRISVEIVAERSHNGWEFVARIYSGSRVAHNFVLNAGGRKFLATSGGFFQWSSITVPHQVRLSSYKGELSFERLRWR